MALHGAKQLEEAPLLSRRHQRLRGGAHQLRRQPAGLWPLDQPPAQPAFVDKLPIASVEAASETGYYGGGPGMRDTASRWDEVNYGSGYGSPGWKRARALGYAGGPPGRTQVIEGEGRLVAVSDPGKPSSYAAGDRDFHVKFGYGAVRASRGTS
jgi:DNA helicase-2/ATP-dependent DNA helicase PcrA